MAIDRLTLHLQKASCGVKHMSWLWRGRSIQQSRDRRRPGSGSVSWSYSSSDDWSRPPGWPGCSRRTRWARPGWRRSAPRSRPRSPSWPWNSGRGPPPRSPRGRRPRCWRSRCWGCRWRRSRPSSALRCLKPCWPFFSTLKKVFIPIRSKTDLTTQWVIYVQQESSNLKILKGTNGDGILCTRRLGM